MIWHMGSQWDQITELKLLRPYHFNNLAWGQESFMYLRKIQSLPIRKKKGVWKVNASWIKKSLGNIYNSVDNNNNYYYTRGGINRTSKILKQ